LRIFKNMAVMKYNGIQSRFAPRILVKYLQRYSLSYSDWRHNSDILRAEPCSLTFFEGLTSILKADERYNNERPSAERQPLRGAGPAAAQPFKTATGAATVAVPAGIAMISGRTGLFVLPLWLFTAWPAARTIRWIGF
jgi:hypothetical protein